MKPNIQQDLESRRIPSTPTTYPSTRDLGIKPKDKRLITAPKPICLRAVTTEMTINGVLMLGRHLLSNRCDPFFNQDFEPGLEPSTLS